MMASNLWDDRFKTVHPDSGGRALLRAFENDTVRYAAIGAQWTPGCPALLLPRNRVINSMLDLAGVRGPLRVRWRHQLRHQPSQIGAFIAAALADDLFEAGRDLPHIDELGPAESRRLDNYLSTYFSGRWKISGCLRI